MNKLTDGLITSDMVAAYYECPRKAFLLFSGKRGHQSEYDEMVASDRNDQRGVFRSALLSQYAGARLCSMKDCSSCSLPCLNPIIRFGDLEVGMDALLPVGDRHGKPGDCVPALIVGTLKVSTSDRIKLAIAAYLLRQIRSVEVTHGIVVTRDAAVHRVNVREYLPRVEEAITTIRQWNEPCEQEPRLLLNKHCTNCEFRNPCREEANAQDDLSLLDGISTEKQISKYRRKGIFTVNQLSYTFRPRKQRKRIRHARQPQHRPELQALAIRTGKVYLQTVPELKRAPRELFLDVEGIPEERGFYLMGIVVRTDDASEYINFWADAPTDENAMWSSFSAFIRQYPDSPVYHYGSYDRKALDQLEKRYGGDLTTLKHQLVNVVDHIYGKIYFPTHSNGLKVIGSFLGARWSSQVNSGRDSIAWRNKWIRCADSDARRKLVQYNEEDCRALINVVDFLAATGHDDDSIIDVDFLFREKKSYQSPVRNILHNQLEEILKLAHASNYLKSKVTFKDIRQPKKKSASCTRGKRTTKGWRVTRSVELRHPAECPKCGTPLETSRRKSQRVHADLVFTSNGVRKSVTKRWGYDGKCRACNRYVRPGAFLRVGRPPKYGFGFKIWAAYLRVSHRLSYSCIQTVIRDTFAEDLAEKLIINFIRDVADNCGQFEDEVVETLLKATYLHVDETQLRVNDGYEYVWVITDGSHVYFRHTENRESGFISEFLAGFTGILVTDFYPGFDALKCRHQKCLVHLIRDMNNDLWASPFDEDFGRFVLGFRNLLVPIMEVMEKHGLKARHLRKYRRDVSRFHAINIEAKSGGSDLSQRYRKRLAKYWDNLFTFLDCDGVPWHNNGAENALRHVTLQSDMSRVFRRNTLIDYLKLLGFKQTCKFQKRSFLKFLLSLNEP